MKNIFKLLRKQSMRDKDFNRMLILLEIDHELLNDSEFRLATMVMSMLDEKNVDFIFLVENEESIHAEAIGLTGITTFTSTSMVFNQLDINKILKKLRQMRLIEVDAIEDKGEFKIYKIR